MKKLTIIFFVMIFILSDISYAAQASEWYKKGFEQGVKEGSTQARVDGFTKGKSEGESKGRSEGDNQGYREGKRRGLEQGKEAGIAKGLRNGRIDGDNDGEKRGTQNGKKRCYDEGFSHGRNEGYSDGYESGLISDGFDKGYSDGKEKAHNVEWEKGYNVAYNKSYSEQENLIRQKILSQNDLSIRISDMAGVFEISGLSRNTAVEATDNQKNQQDFDKGKKDGYRKGYSDNFQKFYKQAYDLSYKENFEKARKIGYDRGFREGFVYGKDEGYRKGYSQGYDEAYNISYNKFFRKEYSYERERGYSQGYAEGEEKGYRVAYDLRYSQGYDKGYQEESAIVYPQAYQKGLKEGKSNCISYYNDNAVPEMLRITFLSPDENGFEAGKDFVVECVLVNFGKQLLADAMIKYYTSSDLTMINTDIVSIDGEKAVKIKEKVGAIAESAEMNSTYYINAKLMYKEKIWTEKLVSIKVLNFSSENYFTLTKAAGFIEEGIQRLDKDMVAYILRLQNIKEEIISICELENLDTNYQVIKRAEIVASKLENYFSEAPAKVKFALKSSQRLLERNINIVPDNTL
ncbi:MAG: hypothetical protein M0R46_03535 [Candidatus Muirbacterium halophilum]|nr:hypothetical protein [Candidatus Muirbacterium halophilum]MCK9474962.1 hypothetical protein [Candidatus Muirbacterium halophilum]